MFILTGSFFTAIYNFILYAIAILFLLNERIKILLSHPPLAHVFSKGSIFKTVKVRPMIETLLLYLNLKYPRYKLVLHG